MTILPKQIETIAKFCRSPATWAISFNSILPKYGITDNKWRLSAFIAQCCHESSELNVLEENLNYTTSNLMKVWPTRFPDIASAIPYAHNPMALANYMYSNRLGNGNEESGDGWKYRGRGLIQTTFKDNYIQEGNALGLPLAEHPEMLLQPSIAVASAAEYWRSHALNALADQLSGNENAFILITKKINPRLVGLDQRRSYYNRALTTFVTS